MPKVIPAMTTEELTSFAKARYGSDWKRPLADETGKSYQQILRYANGTSEISASFRKQIETLLKIPVDPKILSRRGRVRTSKKVVEKPRRGRPPNPNREERQKIREQTAAKLAAKCVSGRAAERTQIAA